MRRKNAVCHILLVVLMLLLGTTRAAVVSAGPNVWTSLGPEGGGIYSLAIDPATPATLYAGTVWTGGVFKSTDAGASWSAIGPTLGLTGVDALAIDPATPTTLYAGTEGAGVFKSTNGGGSWIQVNTGLTNTSVSTLAIDPLTPTTLYAGTRAGGVFKSTNGGASWTVCNNGLTYTNLNAVAIDPLTPATLYAGTEGGVFKSTNGCGSWSAVNTGLTSMPWALAIDPLTPTTLYAGTYGGGVFKSTNGGGNWTAINAGLTATMVWAVAIDPLTPTTLYAGTWRGGVFRSTNGGGNWTAANTGLANSDARSLAIDPATPTTLYAGTRGGVFKSPNGGDLWSAANTGLVGTNVCALATDPATPATLYAGTWGGGVYKSMDGGGHWTAANTGLTGLDVRALPVDPTTPTTLYAGTRDDGVFRSTNGGASWSAANTGLTDTYVMTLAMDPATPAILYAGTDGGGVFKTTNSGGNWSPANTGLTGTNVSALAIDPLTPTTLYAGTWGGVFKSTNSAASWTSVTSKSASSLAIDPLTPTTLYAGTWWDGVYKSTNGGTSWSAANTGLTDTNVRALVIDPASPTTLYAGTEGGGVFRSTNGAGSWSQLNTGLTNRYIWSLACDRATPATLYAGTWGAGVFGMTLTDTPDPYGFVMDGQDGDWAGRDPAATDPSGDSQCGAGTDLTAFYLFSTPEYLYIMQRVADQRPDLTFFHFHINIPTPSGDQHYLVELSATRCDLIDEDGWHVIGPVPGAAGTVAEARIPWNLLGYPPSVVLYPVTPGPPCDVYSSPIPVTRPVGPTATLNIRAYIDGRSHLVVHGDTVYWHHLDYATPGRLAGANQPTYLDGVAWYPAWPDIPDPENRDCNCDSSSYVGIPALARSDQGVSLDIAQARGTVTMIQQPDAANDYSLMVEFDDKGYSGAGWYEMDIEYGSLPHVSLRPSAQARSGVPGATITYSVDLANQTGASDTFNLTLGSHVWDTALSATTLGPVADGVARTFTVDVTIPLDAAWYLTDTVVVTTTSVTSPTVYGDTATLTTQAYLPPQISVAPEVLTSTQQVNQIVTRTLTIHNGHGAPLALHLHRQGDAGVPWLATDPVSGTVPTDGSLPIQVTLDATGWQPTVYSAQILVHSNDPARPVVSVPVTMTVLLPGDMDDDCDVDIVDIMRVASHWDARVGDPGYQASLDLDGDGDIDIVDIMRVAIHWNDRCPPQATWRLLDSNADLARLSSAMAFDLERQVMVMFGGRTPALSPLDGTWEFDGLWWNRVTPAHEPPARFMHSMAYDAQRQRMVLFGGTDDVRKFGDTWEYDGHDWREVTTAHSPAPRSAASLVYDSCRRKVVLFGGGIEGGAPADTWEYDGVDWRQVSTATIPPDRWAAMAFDSHRCKTVLFGGGPGLNDTWEYDGANWTQVHTPASPRDRWAHALAYDASRQRVVLFGGYGPGDPGGSVLGDTWEYDGRTWSRVSLATSPSPREQHAMAYDASRSSVVLFGGSSDSAETWAYRTSGAGEPLAIRFWEQEGDDIDTRILDLLLAKFMTANPDIRVERTHYGNEELRTQFESASLADSAPEVVRGPNDPLGAWAPLGIVLPVTDMFDTAFLDTFLPGALAGGVLKGVRYGIPDNYGNHLMLLYNKALVTAVPADWDELIATAKGLTHGDTWGLALNSREPFWLVPFLGGFGGSPLDPVTDYPTLNTPAMVSALQFLGDLTHVHKIVPPGCDYNAADSLFKQGKAAFLVNGDWSLASYTDAGFDYGTAAMPPIKATGLYPAPMTSGKYWMISSQVQQGTARFDAVQKLVEFMAGERAQQMWLEKGRRLPSNKNVASSPLIQSDPLLQGSMAQLAHGVAMSTAPELRCFWDSVRPGLEGVVDGTTTPAAAAAQMQEDADRCVLGLTKEVGLVTDLGSINDGTFNESAYNGMMRAVQEFGLQSAYIETLAVTDYEQNIEQFAQGGYEIIVTAGFMINNATTAMATKYPNILFAGVDQSSDQPNFAGLLFSEDQSGFLAGCLAGLMTHSNTIGIVAGMQIPPVIKYRQGYEHGARYVNPGVTVLGVYMDSFADPVRGREAALSQIAEGADVIFGAAGATGSAAILAAAQQGVWVLGVDLDEYLTTFGRGSVTGANKLLSSAMKRVDVAVYSAIRNAVSDLWQGGNLLFEAKNDGIGLAPFHEAESAIPQAVKDQLTQIAAGLGNGTITTGVIL